MRNFVLLVIAFACFAFSPKPSYELKIKLAAGKGKAFLSQRVKGEWIKLDSVDFKNGECKFKGVVKNPEIYYLGISGKKEKLPFFIENSVIAIEGKADSLLAAKISGSKVQDEFQSLQNKITVLEKQGDELYKKFKDQEKAGSKVKADSLMAKADAVFNSIDDLQKGFIKANPASYVSPYILSRIYYSMEVDVLEGMLLGLDARLDSVPSVLLLKERVAKLKTVAVGQIAPDFVMNDVDGKPLKLSEIYLKNEYTLIDFWASWCGPCRHENPNVVAVFNDYKAKGFGVFGVSLDNDKGNWLKAIASDKLIWPHVSDLKGWKNEAAGLYVVNSIPSNILVDKNGKIIGRNLREEKLREKIAELLK